MGNKKKFIKRIIKYFILLVILGVSFIFSLNLYVVNSTKKQIIDNIENIGNIDCIVILGAGVQSNKPSPMLKDRLDKGIELYNKGYAPKIIMSGDHGRSIYDEVNIMKKYAIEKGIPSEDIFMDHAGFSTYDSIYRLKKIFEVDKVIIVTQNYHLYRSLYIANQFNIQAYGIKAEQIKYHGAKKREAREVLARDKDVVKCLFKPKATIMGNTISVSGNGDITNDKDIQQEQNKDIGVVKYE